MSVTLQARSGIERSGASRSGYFTPNVVLLINGVDRSAYVWREEGGLSSVGISQVINDEPDTARFTLKPQAVFTPTVDQIVSICLGCSTNPEFAGQIIRITKRYERGTGTSYPWRDVECVDYSRLFDRRVVNAEFAHVSATAIAYSLIDSWTSGFTRASVATGLPTIDSFSVTNESPSSALKRLANLIDGAFYIDARRDVHFFGSAGDMAPKAGTNPRTLTTALTSLKSFVVVEDGSQERTRLLVEGKSTTCPVGTPSGSSAAATTTSADYEMVGPGGGGGADDGGGGGGGEVLQGTDLIAVGSFAVVIPAGGAKGTTPAGNGSAGAGDTTWNSRSARPGQGGLSGFRAGGNAGDGVHLGAAGDGASAAGGGGGADGAGVPAGTLGAGFAGAGGPGVISTIEGTPKAAGGGGGGGGVHGGTGGDGSNVTGGNGGSDGSGSGSPGTANTGGGGGGGKAGADGNDGAAGKVVLSYPTGSITATGGTMTTVGGRTIHVFTANDTWVVSAITTTAPVSAITDLPLNDASQIDNNPGYVRIGNQVTSYLSTGGPVVASGANPPGSTVSSDTASGSTSLPLTSTAPITASPGWVKVGDQYVRFTGIGGGSLTGIPTSGFGALALSVKAGTQVTWLGMITLSVAGVTFDPPLALGATVLQRVIVDDTAAQTALAATEGGDGVHEHPVADGRYNVAGATARGSAELSDFSGALDTSQIVTEDMNARPGRAQAITVADMTTTLMITQSEIAFIVPNYRPRRTCEASTVRTAALLDAIVTATN